MTGVVRIITRPMFFPLIQTVGQWWVAGSHHLGATASTAVRSLTH
jgi:hypothetical protein